MIRSLKQSFLSQLGSLSKLGSTTKDLKQFLSTINKIKPRSNISSSLSNGSKFWLPPTLIIIKYTFKQVFFQLVLMILKFPVHIYNEPEPIDTSDFNISTDQVMILLSELDPSCFIDPDGISSWFLKSFAATYNHSFIPRFSTFPLIMV